MPEKINRALIHPRLEEDVAEAAEARAKWFRNFLITFFRWQLAIETPIVFAFALTDIFPLPMSKFQIITIVMLTNAVVFAPVKPIHSLKALVGYCLIVAAYVFWELPGFGLVSAYSPPVMPIMAAVCGGTGFAMAYAALNLLLYLAVTAALYCGWVVHVPTVAFGAHPLYACLTGIVYAILYVLFVFTRAVSMLLLFAAFVSLFFLPFVLYVLENCSIVMILCF